MTKTAYFPGCSLKTIDRAYDVSTRVVAKDLDIALVEVEDYSCCGAGELKGDGLKSHFLPARNLAHLINQGGLSGLYPVRSWIMEWRLSWIGSTARLRTCQDWSDAIESHRFRFWPQRS